jgi:hypothetical protein
MHLIFGKHIAGNGIQRHRLGRFVRDSKGSDFMRPMHGSRHRDRQMRRLSKGKSFI